MKPVVLSFIGRKGAGKSEVLEAVIGIFKAKGMRAGVIKRLAKDHIEIDQPEKDTFRYRMQGAETVMLAGRKRFAMFSNLEEEMPLEKLLSFFEDFDIVFLEDYFTEDIPKIEIYKSELGEPLSRELNDVLAVCSGQSAEPEAVALLIEKKFFMHNHFEEELSSCRGTA